MQLDWIGRAQSVRDGVQALWARMVIGNFGSTAAHPPNTREVILINEGIKMGGA